MSLFSVLDFIYRRNVNFSDFKLYFADRLLNNDRYSTLGLSEAPGRTKAPNIGAGVFHEMHHIAHSKFRVNFAALDLRKVLLFRLLGNSGGSLFLLEFDHREEVLL